MEHQKSFAETQLEVSRAIRDYEQREQAGAPSDELAAIARQISRGKLTLFRCRLEGTLAHLQRMAESCTSEPPPEVLALCAFKTFEMKDMLAEHNQVARALGDMELASYSPDVEGPFRTLTSRLSRLGAETHESVN